MLKVRRHKPKPTWAAYRTEGELHLAAGGMLRVLIPADAGLWYHVPNQGKRGAATGVMFKTMGMLPGMTDLVFVARRYRAAAQTGFDAVTAFCELKNPTVTGDLHKELSKDQADFRDLCASLGFEWTVENTLEGIETFARQFYAKHGWKLKGRLT